MASKQKVQSAQAEDHNRREDRAPFVVLSTQAVEAATSTFRCFPTRASQRDPKPSETPSGPAGLGPGGRVHAGRSTVHGDQRGTPRSLQPRHFVQS